MSEDDLQKQIKKITRRAIDERKQELTQEKAMKREESKAAKLEYNLRSRQEEKQSTPYTAVIIAKLEYEGSNIPDREQLAEDLGRNIMKWVDQKGFYGINPQEPIPKLISVDVDIV